MEPKDPGQDDAGSLEPNSAAEDFFSKMNRDFRRPKPSEEAVAAALQAIQALAGESALEVDGDAASSEVVAEVRMGGGCPKCGGVNSETNRFCGFCGAALDRAAQSAASAPVENTTKGSEQHVHHHHYHHHYFPGVAKQVLDTPPVPSFRPVMQSLSAGEAPEPTGPDALLRKLVQEWMLLCNGKRVDELAALYADDAVLIRPEIAVARGRDAIQSSLQTALDAGLGDVQLDCTDIGALGDVACLTGTNRMLLPVSPANRQECTGKFLMLVRRAGPGWSILADIWCVDAVHPIRPASQKRK